ncbi:hypothetical protein ES703_75688 [subsurface metagenome]
MKSDIEKDFLKQFENFSKYQKKLEKLADEVEHQYALKDRLDDDLDKDVSRIFFRKKMLMKDGKYLLNNINNMLSLFNEFYSILESQEKIIDNMKNTAKKMSYMEDIDNNKKRTATRLGNMLKRANSHLKKNIKAQIEFVKFDKGRGKYAIKYGKGLMSTENFIKEYHSFIERIGDYTFIKTITYKSVSEEFPHKTSEAIINFQKAWIIK